ncbi:hypothetical protein UlMin_030647, partial [Ulmus minor]
VRMMIVRLCYFFNAICCKLIDPIKIDELQEEVVVTLCLLEKYFPPAFFDVMVHLIVHLPREIKLCGPVWLMWMYPMERYMKILKGYVRNRSRPEGCIIECYVAEEAVGFCSEYLEPTQTIGIPKRLGYLKVWNLDKITTQNSGVTVEGESLHVSSAKDKNLVYANMSYYGVIEDTGELNYTSFKVAMFWCKWVDNKTGVKVDENEEVKKKGVGGKGTGARGATTMKTVFKKTILGNFRPKLYLSGLNKLLRTWVTTDWVHNLRKIISILFYFYFYRIEIAI